MSVKMPKRPDQHDSESREHRGPNAAGVPKTPEQRREALRASLLKHKDVYEALGNS